MGKLNFNDSALRHLAQKIPPDREGRLLYRKSNDQYRERWFRLCGNLLFYFRTNEIGAVQDSSDPVGVLVLARFHTQVEAFGDRPFVFSIVFDGEDGRKHFFSGQSLQVCSDWVDALRRHAHDVMKAQLNNLRLQIQQLTGRDPLAAVPSRPAPVAPSRKSKKPPAPDRPPAPKTAQGGTGLPRRTAPPVPPPPRSGTTFYVDSAVPNKTISGYIPAVPTTTSRTRPESRNGVLELSSNCDATTTTPSGVPTVENVRVRGTSLNKKASTLEKEEDHGPRDVDTIACGPVVAGGVNNGSGIYRAHCEESSAAAALQQSNSRTAIYIDATVDPPTAISDLQSQWEQFH